MPPDFSTNEPPIFSIYLGATSMLIARTSHHGHVEILPDQFGNRVIAATIKCTPNGEKIVGSCERFSRSFDRTCISSILPSLLNEHPQSTVTYTAAHDPECDSFRLPFGVTPDTQQAIGRKAVTQHQQHSDMVTVDEALVILFTYLHAIAARHLPADSRTSSDTAPQLLVPVMLCVSTAHTVPSSAQRLARALQHSHFRLVQLLEWSAAACVAAGLDRPSLPLSATPCVTATPLHRHCLALHCGATSCSVCVLRCVGSSGLLVRMAECTHLSAYFCGDTATHMLADHLALEVRKRWSMQPDEELGARVAQKIRATAESVKIALSRAESHTAMIESLIDGVDFRCTVTRNRFNDLIGAQLHHVISNMSAFVSDHLECVSISHICLCGGSAAIPLLKSKVCEQFPHAQITCERMRPEEVVVTGCAQHAEYYTQAIGDSMKPEPHITSGLHLATSVPTVSRSIYARFYARGPWQLVVGEGVPVPTRHVLHCDASTLSQASELCGSLHSLDVAYLAAGYPDNTKNADTKASTVLARVEVCGSVEARAVHAVFQLSTEMGLTVTLNVVTGTESGGTDSTQSHTETVHLCV